MPGNCPAALTVLCGETPKENIHAGPLFLGETFQPMGQSFGDLQSRVDLPNYPTTFRRIESPVRR